MLPFTARRIPLSVSPREVAALEIKSEGRRLLASSIRLNDIRFLFRQFIKMLNLLKTSGNLKRESEWGKSRYAISRISSKLACLDLCRDFFMCKARTQQTS